MEVDVLSPITVEAEVKNYTLVGDDIYVKRYTNENVPDWYKQLISDIIAQDNTITDINAAVAYLSSLPAGYNQQITSLQNANSSINTVLTSLTGTVGGNTAAIAEMGITKVDADSASAIAQTTVGAFFNGTEAGAWFNNKISTYASKISAQASSLSSLTATVNGQTVKIDTVEEVSIAKAQVILSETAPTVETHSLLKAGDLWINTTNNVVKSWNGDAWVDTTNTEAVNATTELTNQLAKIEDIEATRDGMIDTYYQTTAPDTGMGYGDYWLDVDSSVNGPFTVYRYENSVGGSTGTLGWYVNTGETARAIDAAYVANKSAGTAQATADGKVKTWYQEDEPTGLTAKDVGDIWVNTGTKVTKVWLASTAEGSDYAWRDITNTISNQAYTWSATASKLITSPDGSVTGWSFGDGSNISSYFQIQATNFRISDGTTGYTPFSITGSDISFNGKVTLTGLGIDSTTTTIDGGKITTDSIWLGGTLQSTSFIGLGGPGFRLKSNAANTAEDPSIYGSYITGGTISSSIVYANWVDSSTSSGMLTTKQEFTPSTVPVGYEGSFAKLADNTYLVDKDGFVRLPGVEYAFTKIYSKSIGRNASASDYVFGTVDEEQSYPTVLAEIKDNIRSYDCYTTATGKRCLKSTVSVIVNTLTKVLYSRYSWFVTAFSPLVRTSFLIGNSEFTFVYGYSSGSRTQYMTENGVTVTAQDVYEDDDTTIDSRAKKYVLSNGFTFIGYFYEEPVSSGWFFGELHMIEQTVDAVPFDGNKENFFRFNSIVRTGGSAWQAKPKVKISTPNIVILS